MRPTTSGRFRVFETGRSDDEWLFVEIGTYELGVLEGDGAGPAAGSVVAGADAGSGAGSPETGTPDGAAGSPAGGAPGEDPGGAADPDEEPGDPAAGTGDPDDGAGDPAAGTGEPDPEDLFEPVYVPKSGHGDLDDAVAGLRPGYVVDATIEFDEGGAIVADLAVRKRTLVEFVEGVSTVFQAAQEAWVEAARESEPMNARITRSTDGDPNGVLYVFADPPGAMDVFGEFQSGTRPLEPLLARVNEVHDGDEDARPETPGLAPDGSIVMPDADPDEGGDAGGDNADPDEGGDAGGDNADPDEDTGDDLAPDREVFVISPADDAFVIVYIVLRKGGVLADAVRDTYNRPAPDEPLA